MEVLFLWYLLNLLFSSPSQISDTSKTFSNAFWKAREGIMVKFCLHSSFSFCFSPCQLILLPEGRNCLVSELLLGERYEGITLWLWNCTFALQFNVRQNQRELFPSLFPCVFVHPRVVCVLTHVCLFSHAPYYLSLLWEASRDGI